MIYRELTKLRKEITRLSQENKALKTALTESDSQQLSQSLGELTKLKEIYHSLMFQQRYYRLNPPYVIGIAGSYDEAAQIICRIAEDALRETGKVDLVGYLFHGKQAD